MTTQKIRKRVFVLTSLLLFIAILGIIGTSYSIGPNYRNISVDTTVNITNSKPEVLIVDIDNGISNITLNAGSTRLVTCNSTVLDYNGGNTIANVTAVFYDGNSVNHTMPEDNNSMYYNTSCLEQSVNGYYANYTCTFVVEYYANASNNWICNVTANDVYDFNGIDYGWNYNTTEINTLYALNVTSLIDYGDLAVEDTSTAQEANITNFGNVAINVSVYGYGVTPGDGLAMNCDVGNITIANEKFSLNQTGDFVVDYTSLSSVAQDIGLTIPHQLNDSQQEINSTYWRLFVPPNPFGVCNGTVVFQAEAVN